MQTSDDRRGANWPAGESIEGGAPLRWRQSGQQSHELGWRAGGGRNR